MLVYQRVWVLHVSCIDISHRIHVCYIWWHGSHQYTPVMLAYIPYMDPMGMYWLIMINLWRFDTYPMMILTRNMGMDRISGDVSEKNIRYGVACWWLSHPSEYDFGRSELFFPKHQPKMISGHQQTLLYQTTNRWKVIKAMFQTTNQRCTMYGFRDGVTCCLDLHDGGP